MRWKSNTAQVGYHAVLFDLDIFMSNVKKIILVFKVLCGAKKNALCFLFPQSIYKPVAMRQHGNSWENYRIDTFCLLLILEISNNNQFMHFN